MCLESEMKEFYKHKLWYDFCLYLQHHAESNISETVKAYYKYILVNETSIHPYTFCKTTLVLCDLLEPERSQVFIENAINVIQKNEFLSEERKKTLLKLRIRHNENRTYLKAEEDIGNFIYEIRNTKMDKETTQLYYRLCYKYFETISDFEECHKHFEKYLNNVNLEEQTGEKSIDDKSEMKRQYPSLYNSIKTSLAYKLVKYSLLNPKYFNFTGVTLHAIYKFLADDTIKEIFENIMIGNVDYIVENKKNIKKTFPNHYELLKQKVFLISFINLCFYNKERVLGIEEIKQHLNLERKHVFQVLMKAFGLGLVKGSINGERDIVELNYVIPRILNKDEIVVLKKKYEGWSEKIGAMIKLAE